MNYAIKINQLVNSIWPDHHIHNQLPSQEHLNEVHLFLESLSLNEFHQILELSTQKTLFIVLQKSHIIIQKHIQQKTELLKEINSFFSHWLLPQFPYNLRRSYDAVCLQSYFETSIGKVMGKIIKEISKSNTQEDWEFISSFILSLAEKSHFYQVLVIQGYFSEIENIEEDFEEYDSVREIFKNFEYEIIPKIMGIVIKNLSFCKEILEVVELEVMSNQLSLTNEDLLSFKFNESNQNENISQSRIKYLKMNFEILRRIVEFNYQLEFKDKKEKSSDELGISIEEEIKKWDNFPEYMIRLFLETDLITSLYEVASILMGFKLTVKEVSLGFGEIVLDLINKITRSRVEDLNMEIKEKFVKEVLKGQSKLINKIIDKLGIRESLVIKIVRGNIKILKGISLKEILAINEGNEWIMLTLRLVEFIMINNPKIDPENYLIYKTLSLTKELVYQSILYEILASNEALATDIFKLALRVQEFFIHGFVKMSKLLEKNKYYSLQDLRTKRDRYFHNLKSLSQIHLPQLNYFLQSALSSLKSLHEAANYLLLVSYFITPESMNCGSYFYLCLDNDVKNLKKLTVGNGIVLIQELLKVGNQEMTQNSQFEDAILIFISNLLELYLEHEILIVMTFTVTDTPLIVNEEFCQLLLSKPRLLTSLFQNVLQIIHIKTQRLSNSENDTSFHFYFETFIKYLTLLVNEDTLLHTFEIISIQCELKQYFIEFKSYLRAHFKLEERKFLSEITVLLNHEPEISENSMDYKGKMLSLFSSEIEELLKLLKYNPNDWIGICYEIGGFLQLISEESTYVKVITLIGHEFLNKILMSCIEVIDIQKIKLLTYLIASFLDFTEDEKIKNLPLWLQFVKPIFESWISLFKILSDENLQQERWDEICYSTMRNFLQNDNLNFFMLKRSVMLKDTIQIFTSELILFINVNLQSKKISSKDTNLFKLMRVVFRSYSDYYLESKNIKITQDFFVLVENLMYFVQYKLSQVNKRKPENFAQLIEALKALEVIFYYFNETGVKYSYKLDLNKNIQEFVNLQKPMLKCLENELYKFTLNYEKYIKFSSEKYRKSQINLLIKISNIICEFLNTEKHIVNKNEDNTLESSEEEEKEEKEKQDEAMMESIHSLEKQFIWFDIEGENQIIDY